jgi:type 1 glutamine amidotransferase
MSSELKRVLLVTAGVFHPPYFGRKALHAGLAQMEGFTFHPVRSLEQLPTDFESLAALVLYYHEETISEAALSRMDAFVSNGGGVLAIHSATASFKGEKRYFEILGGRFTGHGKLGECEMQRASPKGSNGRINAIFEGIENFTIVDELYIHELQPGIEIHYMAKQFGQEAPAVWTYQYGQGKVCYCMPGHTSGSMQHPAMQEILRRGLQWVAG